MTSSDPTVRPVIGSRRLGFGLYALAGLALGGVLLAFLFKQLGAAASWTGLLAVWPASLMVLPWFLLPLAAAWLSWRCLLPARSAPAARRGLYLTWVGLGVNWLLPVAMIGGEVVKMRLALAKGMRAAPLIASLVADKTAQVATQLVYTLLGLGLVVVLGGRLVGSLQALLGLMLFSAGVYGFYRIQRGGLFTGLSRRLGALAGSAPGSGRFSASRADAALRRIYRQRRAFWAALAWRMLFRLLLAFEIWLAFYWLGQPVGILEAIAMESLAQGARAAAFFIPAGIGAQEGGLVAAGLLLGLPGEVLLSAALVKRVRELVVGGGALVAWHLDEMNLAWRRHREVG